MRCPLCDSINENTELVSKTKEFLNFYCKTCKGFFKIENRGDE